MSFAERGGEVNDFLKKVSPTQKSPVCFAQTVRPRRRRLALLGPLRQPPGSVHFKPSMLQPVSIVLELHRIGAAIFAGKRRPVRRMLASETVNKIPLCAGLVCGVKVGAKALLRLAGATIASGATARFKAHLEPPQTSATTLAGASGNRRGISQPTKTGAPFTRGKVRTLPFSKNANSSE